MRYAVLFVDNGKAASCLKVQQMALVNQLFPNFSQTFLVNLTLAPSVGYHLKLDPQREFTEKNYTMPLNKANLFPATITFDFLWTSEFP